MIYKFQNCEFDDYCLELFTQGKFVKIKPKVAMLLEILLQHRGRIVSKSEITIHVWGARLVSDGAICNCLRDARLAIGDNGQAQRLIKTFPCRGVRFVGKLSTINEMVIEKGRPTRL